ncbi:heavy-metal-associated domain-containing protein [Streptomyces sp. SBT349]|uniref:heavy-metal-associated domain-containing protein n=1 Tax=Streptomyces sp. SBT349 TaxID=1580539 RepID=UPI00066E2B9E|nr:copper ion binding protein [Streptomyces sp. SBT349]
MSTSPSATVATYTVTGMTCGHCVSSVTTEVGKIPGVARVDVDLKAGSVQVTSENPVDDASVAAAVEEAGYEVVPAPDAEPPAASCCGSCH